MIKMNKGHEFKHLKVFKWSHNTTGVYLNEMSPMNFSNFQLYTCSIVIILNKIK